MTLDKRYGTRRWKKVRLRVLHRDLWECFVPGCGVSASVADHIEPVYPGMPNAWFFNEANLRASCRRHNTARGVAARLQRELAGEAEPLPPNPLITPFRRRAPRIY
jgi:5-methylcytosine-specific restriction endonuclease McrA